MIALATAPTTEGIEEATDVASAEHTPIASEPAGAPRVATLFRTFGDLPRTDVPWLTGLRILWVDDRPQNNTVEWEFLLRLGADLDSLTSTDDAIAAWSAGSATDIVISDMARPEGPEAGLALLSAAQRLRPGMPCIIYAARWAESNRSRAVEAGAFGCTNNRRELAKLVIEAAFPARARRFVGAFQTALGQLEPSIEQPQKLMFELPSGVARELSEYRRGRSSAEMAVSIISAIAACPYVQLFRVWGNAEPLTLVTDRIAYGLHGYRLASTTGVIGRAAASAHTIWVPDVGADPGYIAAEKSTRSELAIPVIDAGGQPVFVVNLERDVPNAYSASQVRWLESLVQELSFEDQRDESAGPLEPRQRTSSPQRSVPVFIATTRRVSIPDSFTGFTAERDELRTFEATVSVPPAHRIGHVEGPSLWRLELRQDLSRHVVPTSLSSIDLPTFAERALSSGETQDALFYVHGFNVTFESNLRQAAVMAHDLQWPGCLVAIDWPSAGTATSYVADVEAAEASAAAFLELAAQFPMGGRRVVIARDVGCRPTLRLLADVIDRIDQLVLLQPEIGRTSLRQLLLAVGSRVSRTTIYTTTQNARWAELGRLRSEAPFGVTTGDTLDVPDVDVIDVVGEPGFLSTDYYPDALIPWSDIFFVLKDVDVRQRSGLRPRPGGWVLRL